MADPTPAEEAQKWLDAGQQFVAGGLETFLKADLTKGAVSGLGQLVGDLLAIAYTLTAPIGIGMAQGMAKAEDLIAPAFSQMAATAVSDVFNIDVSASTFAQAKGRGARADAGNALARGLISQIVGTSTTLQPTDAGATKYLDAMAQMALEDWFKGWFFEVLSSLVPQLDIGKIESYGALGDKVANVLGLGRISRSVLKPYVDATIVTPTTWHVNRIYRPRLVTPAVAIKAFRQEKWSRDELNEELARDGFDARRIEAMLLDTRHELSTSELTEMISSGLLDQEAALPYLKKLGYDDELASVWGNMDLFRRERKYRDDIIPLAIRAYANRDIDGPDLQQALDYALPNVAENNAARAHAEYARSFNVKHLSHAEIKDAVERGILAPQDYRAWLEREGYAGDDALVLELLLESTVRGQQEAAKKRADAEAERAKEKLQRALDAKKRADELAAKKARTFAPLADIERAVVLGILPIAEYGAELARQKFSADDVAFEIALLQQRRDDYLAAQEKKRLAEGPPSPKTIALAQLERAVVRGDESVETYRARLLADNYAADDAAIMVQLVADERADRERADDARAAAADALTNKGLSLAQFEKAVRQGLQSLDDYAAWLVAQGFTPSTAAILRASLAQDIQHAADAAAVRAAVTALAAAKGIGLAPLERAVKLGVRTRADYQAKLVALAVSPDDQVTLLGLLDAELAELARARAKRDAPPPAPPPPGLSRSDVEKAVRAGVQPIGAYRDYLATAGYSAEDADVLLSLLTLEVQDLAVARERVDQVDVGQPARQLARSDMERAVKKGLRTLDDYFAFLRSMGYADDDQALLVELLRVSMEATASNV